jgi:hypothetical protein
MDFVKLPHVRRCSERWIYKKLPLGPATDESLCSITMQNTVLWQFYLAILCLKYSYSENDIFLDFKANLFLSNIKIRKHFAIFLSSILPRNVKNFLGFLSQYFYSKFTSLPIHVGPGIFGTYLYFMIRLPWLLVRPQLCPTVVAA